jgi:hypothetical protein
LAVAVKEGELEKGMINWKYFMLILAEMES